CSENYRLLVQGFRLLLMRYRMILLPFTVLLLSACNVSNMKSTGVVTANNQSTINCVSGKKQHNCQFINAPLKLRPMPRGFFRMADKLVFVDIDGKQWLAPENTITDGASIPQIFIPLIGSRMHRNYINAASVHDAYCSTENRHLPQYYSESWENTHRMFFDALLVNGTPEIMAKIMYAAVYLGGPRWNDRERSLQNASREHLLQEMKWCKRWIKAANPSRQRIEQWMKSREKNLQQGKPEQPNWDRLLAEK
ncbi:MAG: DUF1353 domain-containing protein, partial [Thiolinea sp.]